MAAAGNFLNNCAYANFDYYYVITACIVSVEQGYFTAVLRVRLNDAAGSAVTKVLAHGAYCCNAIVDYSRFSLNGQLGFVSVGLILQIRQSALAVSVLGITFILIQSKFGAVVLGCVRGDSNDRVVIVSVAVLLCIQINCITDQGINIFFALVELHCTSYRAAAATAIYIKVAAQVVVVVGAVIQLNLNGLACASVDVRGVGVSIGVAVSNNLTGNLNHL